MDCALSKEQNISSTWALHWLFLTLPLFFGGIWDRHFSLYRKPSSSRWELMFFISNGKTKAPSRQSYQSVPYRSSMNLPGHWSSWPKAASEWQQVSKVLGRKSIRKSTASLQLLLCSIMVDLGQVTFPGWVFQTICNLGCDAYEACAVLLSNVPITWWNIKSHKLLVYISACLPVHSFMNVNCGYYFDHLYYTFWFFFQD